MQHSTLADRARTALTMFVGSAALVSALITVDTASASVGPVPVGPPVGHCHSSPYPPYYVGTGCVPLHS